MDRTDPTAACVTLSASLILRHRHLPSLPRNWPTPIKSAALFVIGDALDLLFS
jgi:hypothetical protein